MPSLSTWTPPNYKNRMETAFRGFMYDIFKNELNFIPSHYTLVPLTKSKALLGGTATQADRHFPAGVRFLFHYNRYALGGRLLSAATVYRFIVYICTAGLLLKQLTLNCFS